MRLMIDVELKRRVRDVRVRRLVTMPTVPVIGMSIYDESLYPTVIEALSYRIGDTSVVCFLSDDSFGDVETYITNGWERLR